jgi:hypothetical protein
MIERVISGGQTGTDQAALRAAHAAGIPTGGWAPKGWLTEGPLDEEGHPFPKTVASPCLAEWGLVECDEPGFRRLNGKPFLIVYNGTRPSEVSAWIEAGGFGVVNVAGSREGKAKGIGARVERFLCDVFRRV